MRPFSAGVYLSLSYAISAAYDRLGGVTKFEGRTRPKLSTLCKYASTSSQNSEIVMPIDVAIDLDRAVGRPIVLTAMAHALGYDLVPRAGEAIKAHPLTDGDAVDVMGAAMDLVRVIRDAAADGVVCAEDRKAISIEVADLEREVDEVRVSAGVVYLDELRGAA